LLSQLIEIRLFLDYPPIDLVSTDFSARLGLLVLDKTTCLARLSPKDLGMPDWSVLGVPTSAIPL
jgi:hypothetical protein